MNRCVALFLFLADAHIGVAGIAVTGGFEGSNVVAIRQTGAGTFTGLLSSPLMPAPESLLYVPAGNHYHNWFMVKITGAAGQPVTFSILNADWGGSGAGFWGRSRGQCVMSEAADPNALEAEGSWQEVTNASYDLASTTFTFTVTPASNLAWVALNYPALPAHNLAWLEQQDASQYVNVETLAVTPRGRPLRMAVVTDTSVPAAGKRGALVYGQEHANEQNGAWACQGLVEFLTGGDPVAARLRQNVVFLVVPDVNPDASAAGANNHPDTGKAAHFRSNPAGIARSMGTSAPMTAEGLGLWSRVAAHVEGGGRLDLVFNIHAGYTDNWRGVFDFADSRAVQLNTVVAAQLPASGAAWVPNALGGYSKGPDIDSPPTDSLAVRLSDRCREEFGSVAMGYETACGFKSNNFLTHPSGVKYFGEAYARAVDAYFGGFTRTLTLTTPNGGNVFTAGSQRSVQWTSTGTVANVRIELSTDGGVNWSNLVASTANNGTRFVTLPNTNSANCLIRVSDAAAPGVADQSDATFTIGSVPAGTPALTSPNGGETWSANRAALVTWTTSGVNRVHLDFSSDGGSTWRRLARSIVSTGSYQVNVPATLSANCRVRILNAENPVLGDTSDAAFAVSAEPALPALAITSLAPGARLEPGSSHSLTWTPVPDGALVRIVISTNEGASWSPLASSTPDDGVQAVTLPAASVSRCRLAIHDVNLDPYTGRPDADPLALSPGYFYLSADADADGIPDTFEDSFSGFTPGLDDRLLDADGDGQTNAAEFLAGTDPTDSISALRVTALSSLPAAPGTRSLRLFFPTAPRKSYRAQRSTSLTPPAWTDIPGLELQGDGRARSLDVTSGLPAEFFRLRVLDAVFTPN